VKPVRVLVTGGAGFIGSWLVESLLDSGYIALVLDGLSSQIHGEIPAPDLSWIRHPNMKFKRGDVRDATLLDTLLSESDAVVHLAAETGTGQSMYQIARYYDVNVGATAKLLEMIGTKHRHIKKFVFASSRSIYGEGAYEIDEQLVVPPPRTLTQLQTGQWELLHSDGRQMRLVATPEAVVPRPASVYAATKLAAEQLAAVVADAYGISTVALRFQNVYGERQSLHNPYTGILSIFSNRMRQDLPINIFEDGHESRDFVHVSDVVRAIRLALDSEECGFRAINIGSGKPTSVLDIAMHLRRLLGSASDVRVSGDFRVGDIRHCYADLSLARQALGFAPEVLLEEGLGRFVHWVRTQAVGVDWSERAQAELMSLGLGRAGQ
jgi:dTDP-L-rhamnose 4-epimerase